MNLPNKFTVSRLVIAPLFFVSFYLPVWFGPGLKNISVVLVAILYALTETSDLLDGLIARKNHLVTDLGKVMDPFADTVSRLTYFVCFMDFKIMPAPAFVIILWRELSILFVRMLMMGKGKAVPANIWGKSKAFLYALSGLGGIILYIWENWFSYAAGLGAFSVFIKVLFYLAAAASVGSFLTYVNFVVKDGSLKSMTR